MKNVPIPEVYIKPSAPRSNWQIFKWLFFEPDLLKRWEDENYTDDWGTARKFLFIYCCYFAPIIFIAWVLMITGLVWADIPGQYPEVFMEKNEANAWYTFSSAGSKLLFLVSQLAFGLATGLAAGLILGLAAVLVFSLSSVLVFGLTFGLLGGLAFGLSGGLSGGLFGGLSGGLSGGLVMLLGFGISGELAKDLPNVLRYVLIFGLSAGLILGGLIFGLAIGLAIGLTGELIEKWTVVFVTGLGIGLIFGVPFGFVFYGFFGANEGKDTGLAVVLSLMFGFYIAHLRLLFYPFYLLQFFRKYTLAKNPYLNDLGIWLPLPWVNLALSQQARQEPELALHFVNFLLRYRPLQRRFAAELERIATAALWSSELRLYSHFLEGRHFLEEKLPQEWARFAPSNAWRKKIREIRETLRSVEATTAIVAQQSLLQSCSKLIEEFEAINLREGFFGREEYFPVIDHWKQVLGNQLQEVAEKVAASQAITLNPYSKGNALTPTLAASSPLFLDRADIKEELSLKIQTSAIMPTFLILGQRRVGKTSLLNFLPRLLDPNLYDVVVVDAQGLAGESSLLEWLKFWRKRIESQLSLPLSAPSNESDPLKAWDQFAAFLNDLAQKRQRRLILAMDEYDEERGLHYAIRQDPELGAAFLGRMRAFAQQQKLVVFLFVGASYFSDLPEPKWSKYFVQTHIVRVDYLSEAASMQLIEQPVPNFALRYAPGIAKQIYELTQGHPHLLHSICSDLVDYANIKVKNPIEQSDLEYILRHNIVLRGEQPFSVFWDEFCATEAMQVVVKAIAFGQSVDPQQAEVRKLADYGYILPNGDGSYRMRVPLFADWVRQFGY